MMKRRKRAAGAWICSRRCGSGGIGIGSGEQAPGDFNASSFRFALADQTCRSIAIKFAELIAINSNVVT